MPVSPEKRAANRRNALKSTGPKSRAGREVSSRNAILHGLSVPLPPHINNPLQHELAQLIERDGIVTDVAHDLAQKIIDYERNVSFLIEVFVNDMVANREVGEIKLVASRWQEKLENQLADVYAKHLKGMPWEEENMTRLTVQVTGLIRRVQKDELSNSRRYFKRSSNQLIKAMRRL